MELPEALQTLKPHLGDTVRTAKILEGILRTHLEGDELEELAWLFETVWVALPKKEVEAFRLHAPNVVTLLEAK